MRFHFICVLLFLGIFLLNCENITKEENNEFDADCLIPFNIDNYWIYEVTDFDSLGNVTTTYFDTIFYPDTVLWEDSIVVFVEENSPNAYANMIDGVHYFHCYIDEEEIYHNGLIYKYPCEQGDEYGWFGALDINLVVSTSEKISVFDENYKCIFYQLEDAHDIYEVYICPGIGIIKQSERYIDNTNIKYLKKLKDYKIDS